MPLLIGCSGINCKWANAVQKNRMELCLIPPDFTPNPLSFEEFIPRIKGCLAPSKGGGVGLAAAQRALQEVRLQTVGAASREAS